ncbi:unnamed protein product [Cylindrotheca closterium]|uniref:Uncharacterized protein n=1 Tax=Cylindrotheca closterium TaxID=2856 RepID=A0AAD2GBW8_9STRA|nr:unnamed protein product [Cylindrotheca closterium]
MGKSSKQSKKAGSAKAANAKTGDQVKSSSTKQQSNAPVSNDIAAEHLPPIGLVFTVIACSGFLFVFFFRDVFATGRVIGGASDQALLSFTKSLEFFDDSKGWSSTQGGLSAIKPITTDANNMGSFYVRKMAGAAGMTLQIQKMMPLLIHPRNARWNMGHFIPLLWTASVTNLLLAAFYGSCIFDLMTADAAFLPTIFIGILMIEATVMLFYIMTFGQAKRGPAIALKQGKTPTSVVSRIVARTVFLVSGAQMLFAARDLFYPGLIMSYVPGDDVFLEWVGALIHSPPEGSPEEEEYGMAATLHVGDKFASQLLAANMLLLCMYKFVSAFLIRYGSDGGGLVKAQMIWKSQAIGGATNLLLVRLFTSAATSASVDIRWHVMAIAYETFILGLHGFFF